MIQAAEAYQHSHLMSDNMTPPGHTVCHLDIGELETRTSEALQ